MTRTVSWPPPPAQDSPRLCFRRPNRCYGYLPKESYRNTPPSDAGSVLWLHITSLTSLPDLGDAPEETLQDVAVEPPRLVSDETRRSAAATRRVRGFFAVVMVLMLTAQAADAIPGASLPPLPLGVILAGVLLFVNFVDPTRDPGVTENLAQRRLLIELSLDSAVVFAAIWLVGLNPASNLWVMLAFPMIQVVVRLDVKRMAMFLGGIAVIYAAGELWAASRYQDLSFEVGALVQQIGVLLAVSLIAANHRPLSTIASTIFNTNSVNERQRERRRSPGDGFGVVYVDVVVEDKPPADVVPEILREVIGRRISACVRDEDQVLTSDADAFAVLLEGLHELMDATVVAERILNRLEGPVAVSGVSIEIDTRVGVAYSPNSVGNPDGLIEAAGREVHVARRNGDDRLVIHEPVDPLQTAVG